MVSQWRRLCAVVAVVTLVVGQLHGEVHGQAGGHADGEGPPEHAVEGIDAIRDPKRDESEGERPGEPGEVAGLEPCRIEVGERDGREDEEERDPAEGRGGDQSGQGPCGGRALGLGGQ